MDKPVDIPGGAAALDSAWPERLAAKAPVGAWWMLAALLLFNIMAMMDRTILSLLVEPIKADLRLTDFEVSLIMGPAFAVSFVVFTFPLGWAADRLQRRWVVFSGLIGWSIATIAGGFATSGIGLAGARSLIGAGEAALTPAAYSLIADRFPRQRVTTALSIFAMGPKVGQAIAFALGGIVLAAASGADLSRVPLIGAVRPWQLVLILFGTLGLLLSLLCLTFTEPVRIKHRLGTDTKSNDVSLLTYVGANKMLFLPLLAGFTLMTTINGAVVSWLPTYMGRVLHWTPAQFGPAIGAASILAAASLFVNGMIVDSLFKRGMKDAHVRYYSWMVAALIPILAIAFVVTNPWLFLLCYCLMQAVAFTYLLYMSATIQLITPGQLRGRMTALFSFAIVIVSLGVGPTLVAFVTDFVFQDPAKLGWSIGLVSIVSCVLALVALRVSLLRVRTAVIGLETQELTPLRKQPNSPVDRAADAEPASPHQLERNKHD